MKRILLACVVLAVAVGTARSDDRGSSSKPNIIVILADDLGYNDLACYGQLAFHTPHTDRLAAEGLRFTDAHTPSAICSATRYGVLTGTSPFRRYHTSHVLFNGEPLVIRAGELTLGSLLQGQGYATAVIGKWHLGLGNKIPRDLNHPGRGPNDIGFDESFLVPDGHNMEPRYYLENGEVVGGTTPSFDGPVQLLNRLGYRLVQVHSQDSWEDRRPNEQIGARLTEKAISFIERHRDRPFFLYLPTCSIHGPQTPDPQFAGQSGIGRHGDFVMEFDWTVGQIMETLERLELVDNTLLIVTSDNGGYAQSGSPKHRPPAPWRGAKDSSWEGGHRVPLLARWPGHIAVGTVTDELVSLLDLAGTFAGLVDAKLPSDAALDSFDLGPVLLDSAEAEAIRPVLVAGRRGMATLSLREGPWKLILTPETGRTELYRLDEDPTETHDLAAEESQQLRVMRSRLDAWFEAGASRPRAKAEGRSLDVILAEKEERNALIESRFGK